MEEIEAKAEQGEQAEAKPKTKAEKPMAPGDFVIESKGPGKAKKLAKDIKYLKNV